MAQYPPTIVAGKSKITGVIKNLTPFTRDSIFVHLTVPNPISGETIKYKAIVDQSGKFAIDAEVETNNTLISLYTSINPSKYLFIKLTNGGITHIDITYNAKNQIDTIRVKPSMHQKDIVNGMEVFGKIISHKSGRKPQSLYNETPDYFLNYAKTILLERLEILKSNTDISEEFKEILAKDFHLFLYKSHVFNYEDEMILNYRNTNEGKSDKTDFIKIDRTYYRFLKDFNLNDPQYLNTPTFLEFQKEILRNEILNLPLIEENDIPSWLSNVKATLSDLVGFNDGQYYDILAANAYARQLNEELRPLSKKQKENISNYWKNGEIVKILFKKNQQVVELDRFKAPVVLNDVSSVSNEKLIATILSKYKNKVVFIDLWATWCGPCLDAMQRFRNTKNQFKDKDIVFVYLTNASSPKKLWEEKIKGIGNEHYYLTDTQWEYIMNKFEFEGIPSYLLYDKSGKLINKFTAFPENEKVREIINSLL
jgi:thiol-disulfide isomerase/thioredoxin